MSMRCVTVLGLLLIGLTLGLHLSLTYSSCVKTIWVHRDLASRTTRPRPSVIITMPPEIIRYTSKELYALRDKSVEVQPTLLFYPVNYNSRQHVSEKKRGCRAGSRRYLYTPTMRNILGYPTALNHNNSRRAWDKNSGVHWNNLHKVDVNYKEKSVITPAEQLTISTVNTRSIRNKSADVLHHVLDKNIDLCVITETWLRQDGDDYVRAELKQKGFNLDDVPRSDRTGGGLALFYRDNLRVQRTHSSMLPSCEYAEWSVDCQSYQLTIAALYRPPHSANHPSTHAQFLNDFPSLLDRLTAIKEPIIIMGDLNFHFDDGENTYTKQLTSLLESYDLLQLVNVPTHTSGHTLDVIISRGSDNILVSEPYADYFISDHSFTSCVISRLRPQLSVKNIQFRKWTSLNDEEFISDLCNLKSLPEHSTDVDLLVHSFSDTLADIVNKHVPLKEKRITCRPEVPWYSVYLREFKQVRRTIEKIHIKYKSEISGLVYKKTKNRYIAAVASAKADYYCSRIEQSEGNSKKLYAVISDLLGRVQENPLPARICDSDLANQFLDFFMNKIVKLRLELDSLQTNTINNSDTSCVRIPAVEGMNSFQPLTEADIQKLILGSKATTCELDLIPTTKLKEFLPHFLPVVTEIVNRSLETGVFPQAWKTAVVKPLLKKKGLTLEMKNYRPISNLCFLSKILEKAGLQQVVEHVESNHLLPSYQSAYRRNHGVETAMVKMYSDLLKAVDQQQVCVVVMMDLSAAFDTVDIPIMINILKQDFNISGTPLSWFESYLTDRTMRVVVNNSSSRSSQLHFGVPQGSCAGPVLFTLYVAALNRVVQKYSPTLHGYADDHKIALACYPGNSDSEAEAKAELERCLQDIVFWMADQKLKMNNSKTEIIIYGTKQQLAKVQMDSICVGGVDIKCVDSVRDLGVLMDSALSFDQHITKKCQIANHQLHNLNGIRNYLPQKMTETLVHGLLHSHLDFCNALLSGLPNYKIDKFQKLQNRAARIVTKTPFDSEIKPVLRSLHWLPLQARIRFKVLVLVYRCLNGTAPVYLSNMLCIKTSVYSLRSVDGSSLEVPRTRTKIAERSFHVIGPKWWNALPLDIKNSSTEDIFRRNLKTQLFREFL
jgi:hypothetical protein